MAARLIAGLIFAVGVLLLAFVGLRNNSDTDTAPASSSSVASPDQEDAIAPTEIPLLADAPENFGRRKDLVNLDGWLNTEITSLDELDGKVVLVEMWTFGCSNCKARIPHNQDLYANHSRDEFEIVGVHAPEFSFEAEIPNIEAAVLDLGVNWPVAIDTNKENFRAWQDGGRRFWPRTYVVDQNGDVRFDHIGEGKYDELEQTINWLLENPPA